MLKLPELDLHLRQRLAWDIHVESSIKLAKTSFEERFPEAHVYSYDAILAYSKSQQCVEEQQNHREQVIENFDAMPFVRRAERIEVLKNLVATILKRIKASEKKRVPKEARIDLRTLLVATEQVRKLFESIATEFLPYESAQDGIVAPQTLLANALASIPGLNPTFIQKAFPEGLPKPGLNPPAKKTEETN